MCALSYWRLWCVRFGVWLSFFFFYLLCLSRFRSTTCFEWLDCAGIPLSGPAACPAALQRGRSVEILPEMLQTSGICSLVLRAFSELVHIERSSTILGGEGAMTSLCEYIISVILFSSHNYVLSFIIFLVIQHFVTHIYYTGMASILSASPAVTSLTRALPVSFLKQGTLYLLSLYFHYLYRACGSSKWGYGEPERWNTSTNKLAIE